VIRRATATDAPAVAALFRRSYGTLTFLPTLHTPDEDRAHFAGLIEREEVWVEEEDGRLRGFIVLTGNVLEALYVEPDVHGHGVGSALFDHAKQLRPDGFEFWVFQRNERARRFYEARGCRLIRLTDGSANEEREPDALYEWRPANRAAARISPARAPGGQGRGSSAR
jgi:GNAT superfamily N-acetyltransferase